MRPMVNIGLHFTYHRHSFLKQCVRSASAKERNHQEDLDVDGSIKTDLETTECDDVNRIKVAHGRDQHRFVKAVETEKYQLLLCC
jgi:hypothetical protein